MVQGRKLVIESQVTSILKSEKTSCQYRLATGKGIAGSTPITHNIIWLDKSGRQQSNQGQKSVSTACRVPGNLISGILHW